MLQKIAEIIKAWDYLLLWTKNRPVITNFLVVFICLSLAYPQLEKRLEPLETATKLLFTHLEDKDKHSQPKVSSVTKVIITSDKAKGPDDSPGATLIRFIYNHPEKVTYEFESDICGAPWAVVTDNNQNINKFGQLFVDRDSSNPRKATLHLIPSEEARLTVTVYAMVR